MKILIVSYHFSFGVNYGTALEMSDHFAFGSNYVTALKMSDDVDSEKAVEEWIPKFIKKVVPPDEEVNFYIDGVMELTGENIQWRDANIEAHYELIDDNSGSFETHFSFTTQRPLL